MADGTRRPVRSNDEKRFEEKRGLSNRIDPDGMPVDRRPSPDTAVAVTGSLITGCCNKSEKRKYPQHPASF